MRSGFILYYYVIIDNDINPLFVHIIIFIIKFDYVLLYKLHVSERMSNNLAKNKTQ